METTGTSSPSPSTIGNALPVIPFDRIQPQSQQRRLYFEPQGKASLKLYYGDEKFHRAGSRLREILCKTRTLTPAELAPEVCECSIHSIVPMIGPGRSATREFSGRPCCWRWRCWCSWRSGDCRAMPEPVVCRAGYDRSSSGGLFFINSRRRRRATTESYSSNVTSGGTASFRGFSHWISNRRRPLSIAILRFRHRPIPHRTLHRLASTRAATVLATVLGCRCERWRSPPGSLPERSKEESLCRCLFVASLVATRVLRAQTPPAPRESVPPYVSNLAFAKSRHSVQGGHERGRNAGTILQAMYRA